MESIQRTLRMQTLLWVAFMLFCVISITTWLYDQSSQEAQYETTARQFVDTMYTSMLLAEDINTLRFGVISQAGIHRKYTLNPWIRVINRNPKGEIRDPEKTFQKYIWKEGVGYLPVDSALSQLRSDPEFHRKITALQSKAAEISKLMKSVKPART